MDAVTPADKAFLSKAYGINLKLRTDARNTFPPPPSLDRLYEFDERLHELQETVDKLEYILVQHTDMLDGIAHNQAIINNRLTSL